jgi:hemerythrin superfamily protein
VELKQEEPMATQRSTPDATALLQKDHEEVKKLFRKYERGRKKMDNSEKRDLAAQICTELTVHAQIEEEIFYPALRRAIEDSDLLDEAMVEHASAKQLIAELEAMRPTDALFDAKVKVLGEYVSHHVEEEEDEIFKKARSRKAKLDLQEMGERIEARKAELLSDPTAPPEKGRSRR